MERYNYPCSPTICTWESKSRYHGEHSSMACEGRNERIDPKHWSSGLHLLSIYNLTPKDLQAPQMHSAAAAPRNRRLDGWVMNKGSHTIQLHTHPSQKNWCPCLAGQFTVRLNVQLHAACHCLYISSRVTRPSYTLLHLTVREYKESGSRICSLPHWSLWPNKYKNHKHDKQRPDIQ